ncbi:site-specific integrase, partial [Pseudooctadecabacter sp.]|uniref:site-specific integrase n=1 Tax=Pseudooctadecabacter sp. TaxID=1966338 RepID=UPI0035C866DC
LMTFLGWCQRKGKMSRMPAAYSEIKVADPVRKEDKRAAFSNEQLNVIFRSQVYQDQERRSSLFWVPLIALWNGMRSNEICQLDVADIKLEENVWGFDVTHISTTGDDDKSVKTGSSIRFVPMHPRLIEFGLLDFYRERPLDAKLFGDITRGSDGYYSTNFSKQVNRYLKRIGAHGPKHKFHSFRHNFRDALRKGRVDREIGKALGGWTSSNTDAFDIYGNGYDVGELKGEIIRVDYPDVDWTKI